MTPALPDRDDDRAAMMTAIRELLHNAHLTADHDLPELASRHVTAFGGTDVTCYLADLQQTTLVPFLGAAGAGVGQLVEDIPIDTTLAGRAFQLMHVLPRRNASDWTVWLPLLNGTERLGVLAVTVPGPEAPSPPEQVISDLRLFASLLAEFVTTKTLYGDTIVRLRRQGRMGLAAELQWALLPPLSFASTEVTIAAVLEPAYEIAGDTVDYAVDHNQVRLGIFDGMGHGLVSAQQAAMAVAAYRHARRVGRNLIETAAEIDAALLQTFRGQSFSTAVLVELDTPSGTLSWLNAGHPAPLLLRSGQLVKVLETPPRPPLGADVRSPVSPVRTQLGVEHLEPGDCVVFYTDGVVEARSPDGEFFGEQRLADLIVRNFAAGLAAPETMRRVVRELLEHQQGRLTDDATLAVIRWPTDVDAMTVQS